MLRVGVAAACLSTVMLLPLDSVKPRGALTLKVLSQTALTGILAMGIGMTLLLYALSGGKSASSRPSRQLHRCSSCRSCG